MFNIAAGFRTVNEADLTSPAPSLRPGWKVHPGTFKVEHNIMQEASGAEKERVGEGWRARDGGVSTGMESRGG